MGVDDEHAVRSDTVLTMSSPLGCLPVRRPTLIHELVGTNIGTGLALPNPHFHASLGAAAPHGPLI